MMTEPTEREPMSDKRPLTWNELRSYEREQGGYWEYGHGEDVYGNGRVWVPVANPAAAPNEPMRDEIAALRAELERMHKRNRWAHEARQKAEAALAELRKENGVLRRQRAIFRDRLADAVVAARVESETADGFIAWYLMPTGPIHKAIPVLQEHAWVIVRSGFDGREDPRHVPDPYEPESSSGASSIAGVLAEQREAIAARIAAIGERRARNAHTTGPLAAVDRVQADTYRTAAWLIRNPDQLGDCDGDGTALERAADEQGAAFDAARKSGPETSPDMGE